MKGFFSWRDGLYEKSRTWVQETSRFLNAFSASLCTLFSWQARQFVTPSDGSLYREDSSSAGTFSTVSGVGSQALSQWVYYMPNVQEQNGALLLAFNGSNGWYKLDTLTGSAFPAGVPRALDPVAALVAAGTLLASGQSRAYRVVFGRRDGSPGKNLVLGAPSGRVVVTATAAQDVSLTCYLPVQITALTTPYFVQVYASAIIAGTTSDDLQLVYQKDLSAADLAAGFVTITDNTPDGWRSTALYTNPAQEGIARANLPPPIAYDACYWRGCAWAANTNQKYSNVVQMLATPPVLTISAISVGTGVYTFSGTPDLTGIVAGMELSVINGGGENAANVGTFSVVSVNAGAYTITTNNAASVAHAGASTAVCARISVAAQSYEASLSAESAANRRWLVTTSGTAQQNVAATASSLIRVLNQYAFGLAYAFYASGPDDAAGLILIQGRGYGQTVTVFATGNAAADKWAPNLRTSQASLNDAAPGRLARSKYLQPEHWAGADFEDVGNPTAAIWRIIPLRDSLIVWKADGIFRVTGTAGSGFAVSRIAPGTLPLAGNTHQFASICSWGDRAYGATTRGLLEITDTSSRIISGGVSDIIACDGFKSDANLGLGYCGLDDTIHVEVYFSGGKTYSYTYAVRTGLWGQDSTPYGAQFYQFLHTFGPLSGSLAGMMAAISSSSAKNIYWQSTLPYSGTPTALGAAQVPRRTQSDFLTFLGITAVNAGAGTITATTYGDTSVGVGSFVLSDDGYVWQIVSGGGPTYTLAPYGHSHAFSFSTNTINRLLTPQTSYIEWQPVTLGNEAILKNFLEVEVILDKTSLPAAGGTHSVTVYNETDATGITQTFTPTTLAGTPTNLRVVLPPSLQTCRRLHVKYSHSAPDEYPVVKGLAVLVEPLDGNELT